MKEKVEAAASDLIVSFFKLLVAKKTFHWTKVLIYQIDFDMKKRSFSDINNEYKNNRQYDPYYPVFRALVDLELKIEQAEKDFVIKKKSRIN